jgi:hypothetical protein
MPAPWPLRDTLSMFRALQLRWATRRGHTVGDVPAFAPEVIEWFRAFLPTVSGYIEYGSGASTILAARAGVRTISMETDTRYAAAVRAALPPRAPVTVLEANIGWTENWGYPVCTRRSSARLTSWRNYALAPFDLAEQEKWLPQLVLVDGRFRRACALAAAQAIIAAGAQAEILFDDYLSRSHYAKIEEYLGKPRLMANAALFTVGSSLERRPPVTDAVIREASADYR